jgi:hypothetical protein
VATPNLPSLDIVTSSSPLIETDNQDSSAVNDMQGGGGGRRRSRRRRRRQTDRIEGCGYGRQSGKQPIYKFAIRTQLELY